MIELQSLEGPDVHGPRRYKVANPAKDKDGNVQKDRKYSFLGLSSQNVMLDGEMVFVHHVSHVRLPTYPTELVIITQRKPLKRMQCKDIPDVPILEFLVAQTDGRGTYKWSTHGIGHSMPTVNDAMPPLNASQWKLAPAKMNQLIRRGLVSGCTLLDGRGDYVITRKGCDYLNELAHDKEIEESNYPSQEIDFK